MSCEGGFDLVPRVSNSARDTQKWETFIDAVLKRYETDGRVRITGRYIKFYAGDGPMLPFDGQKFLRFGTKVWGFSTYGDNERFHLSPSGVPKLPLDKRAPGVLTEAQSYINTVIDVATAVFGIRVKPWDVLSGTCGFYEADVADMSIEAYTKVNRQYAAMMAW
jgi:hypothetical protein